MKLQNLLTICIALLFTAACGEAPSDDQPTDQPTKDDVRAMGKADGFDWCEMLGWYGDGICDDFCQNPDPDCGDEEPIDCTTAFVVPGCESGEMLVNEATCNAAGDECETSELCGVVSHCLYVGEYCPQVVGSSPVCPADTYEVAECETESCLINRGTGDKCTEVTFCEPINWCLALPTCQAGYEPIDAMTCSVAGEDCVTETACGQTQHCLYVGEFCPQVVGTSPVCPADTAEVEECQSESCIINYGTGDKCTETIFCEPINWCLAIPSCQANEYNVGTDECLEAGDFCRNETMCGQTLHCMERPQFCPQVVGTPPACPAGKTEVGGCSTNALNDGSCEVVFGTGDKCADLIYCQD